MSGPIHSPRALSPLRPRPHHPRPSSSANEPGLCALEDYSYLAGESIAARSLRAQLRRVSPHFRLALISGEEGTGKEAVALALHRLSAESDATFFSHTPASLLAAFPELLANAAASGSPVREGGAETMFLPEVADLTFGEQMYLRQALRRVAESKRRAQLPRMIFASGSDLRSLSAAGHFDRALYRAISAVEIILPPLRSRTEDIPLITCGMLSRSVSSGSTGAAFDGRALSLLQCHDWPGNVRELEQIVDIARQNAGDNVIEAIHLPPLGEFASARHHPREESHPDNRVDRLEDVVQSHVLDVLMRCQGNKVRAAERLGISRSTLYRMLDARSSDSDLDRIA
jgi:DNA-binding NtrC family response regulator